MNQEKLYMEKQSFKNFGLNKESAQRLTSRAVYKLK